MHVSRSSSAAALPSTLLPLLLLLPGSLLGVSASSVADRSACIRSSAVSLAAAAACGDKGSLEHCFRTAREYVEAGDLERCFRNAGCTNAEAGIEASFVLHSCDAGQSVAELRRRRPEPVPGPTPAPVPQDTTTTAAASGAFTPSIQCSTSTDITTSSCPIQSTGTESGSTLPCFETTVATSVCAAANLCMTDKNGVDICMVRKDGLDTGGLVVTIFLAVCFAVGFATLIFFACRDKRSERKLRARKEAAAIAKTNAANATSTMAPIEETAIPPKREPSPAPGSNPFADGPRY
ncbi:hypothetical protein F4804DRAFT_149913 [Jackrogersella minutella]|nr:hypothetical protein F4804DRAFT_149913 [Jackrogersella minutella]